MKINNAPPLYRMIALSEIKSVATLNKIAVAPKVQPMPEKPPSVTQGDMARQMQINKSMGTKTVFGQNGILISQKRDAKGNVTETYPPADMIRKAYKVEN